MPLTVPEQQFASGWGRAAVGRFSKTPEQIQAEIIKALEGKLSVEFKDYSQWQRISFPQPQLPPPPIRKPVIKPKKIPRPLTGASGTSCSTLCLHPWNKKPPPVDDSFNKDVLDRIVLLRVQIEGKRKAVKQYQSLCQLIKVQNESLQAEIDEVSSHAHKNVTRLLENYKKYTGASKTLQKIHIQTERDAHTDLDVTRRQLGEERAHLEKEVQSLDYQLKELLKDLQVLRTYKDKEYPVKSMQMSKLRQNLNVLDQEQKSEQNELKRITVSEANKLINERETRINDIMQNAADEAFDSMVSVGLQHMAWHNTVLEHDIEEHRRFVDHADDLGYIQAISELENDIYDLEYDIRELKQNPRTRPRSFVFPEAFLPNNICHPDEDVVLDIPVQQVLPL